MVDSFLMLLNLMVTTTLLIVVLRQTRGPKRIAAQPDQPRQDYQPIRHPKVEGPTSAQPVRGLSYWRLKDDPKAEPILVAWYEKDTTPERWYVNDTAGDPEAMIPADTFVDLTGRKMPGPKFRSVYEPAQEVMVVAKVHTKLRTSTIVSGPQTAPQLSPEEEDKLAAEYELGGSP